MNNKVNVLVVDDESNLRNLLSKVLRREGYGVFTAKDGVEGLEVMQKEAIDLIISDIKMPRMDGIQFLHEAKRVDPTVAFVLITAFATTETAIEAIKMGAQDYITKPFDINDVLNTIKKLGPCANAVSNLETTIDHLKVSSKSAEMQSVLELARQVSKADSTVLIMGETGTGKEVIATAIHNWSSRSDKPMIKVNCGAIPDNLLESELFGYERGAFTGAVSSKPGKFEIADGGTIFLDEIGEISPAIQVKLLRVIQERTIERLGGLNATGINVRIIAATNRDLKREVEEKRFREDLYYRLNVVPVNLPPLRNRKEDIEDLVKAFLEKASRISGCAKKNLGDEVLQHLKNYSWPGNIRELENIIERAVVITPDDTITLKALPPEIAEGESESSKTQLTEALDNKEKETIIRAIRDNDGNKTKAALELGISRRSLHRKIQKYDIKE